MACVSFQSSIIPQRPNIVSTAPFPPNGGGPGGPPNGFLPFPPDFMNGQKPGGPPPSFVPASSNSGGQGSGPNIHPDRMRMLNGGGGGA